MGPGAPSLRAMVRDMLICLKSFPSHGCITLPDFVSFKRYERWNLDVRREVKNVFPDPFPGRGYSHFNRFQTCPQSTDYANSVLIRQQPFIILYTNADTYTDGTENVHFLRSVYLIEGNMHLTNWPAGLQYIVRVATRYTPPVSSPCGRPSASRVAEQTQRSSTFPRPIRSHGHRYTCACSGAYITGVASRWEGDATPRIYATVQAQIMS